MRDTVRPARVGVDLAVTCRNEKEGLKENTQTRVAGWVQETGSSGLGRNVAVWRFLGTRSDWAGEAGGGGRGGGGERSGHREPGRGAGQGRR